MRWSPVVLLLTTLVLLPSAGSCAQDARPSHTGLGLWYGESVGTGAVLGKIEKGRMRLLGLRYHYLLLPGSSQDRTSYDAPTLTYTVDLIPFTQLHIPEEGAPGAFFPAGPDTGTPLTTYGLGGYPVGLRLQFGTQNVRPFLTGHTGLLYFFDRVPDDRGRQLNFAAALGGGLHIFLPHRTSLTVEYRYHHLSNGFRGSINPGLDVNVLSLGVDTAL